MLYYLNDLRYFALYASNQMSDHLKKVLSNPSFSFGSLPGSRVMAAACEVFERTTRRFAKPSFGINQIKVGEKTYEIQEETLMELPFCKLLHFKKKGFSGFQPPVLMVAPLSGHFATLLRDTVHSMLEDHDVYITDWEDARDVPLSMGSFDFDDYVQYIIDFIKFLGPQVHILGVCQPAVQVLIAVGILSMSGDIVPRSMTIMGGPIDTRINPTQVDDFAKNHSMEWFRNNFITQVPSYYPGAGRNVYPGFLQLTGFISMHLERHMQSYMNFFGYLIQGNEEKAESHRKFYNEYLSVMDMTAEFFLSSVEKVFKNYDLPQGNILWEGKKVDFSSVRQTALMTVEGEMDDISSPGQTEAAHDLCTHIPDQKRVKFFQTGVGHYGIFNGTKWRTSIMPRIRDFIKENSK